jgi:hypothetical protein
VFGRSAEWPSRGCRPSREKCFGAYTGRRRRARSRGSYRCGWCTCRQAEDEQVHRQHHPDDAETVRKKVMSMYTDPTRLRAADPGHLKGNPVFVYHDAFNENYEEVKDLKARYTKGTVGDVEVGP